MNKSKIFKTIALLNFVVLLILFILFRTGTFDDHINSYGENSLESPNGGTPAIVLKDSLTMANDSLKRQRLASSKSIVLIDHIDLKDEKIKHENDSLVDKLSKEKKSMMYSSKSALIIDPNLFLSDSLKIKAKMTKTKK